MCGKKVWLEFCKNNSRKPHFLFQITAQRHIKPQQKVKTELLVTREMERLLLSQVCGFFKWYLRPFSFQGYLFLIWLNSLVLHHRNTSRHLLWSEVTGISVASSSPLHACHCPPSPILNAVILTLGTGGLSPVPLECQTSVSVTLSDLGFFPRAPPQDAEPSWTCWEEFWKSRRKTF